MFPHPAMTPLEPFEPRRLLSASALTDILTRDNLHAPGRPPLIDHPPSWYKPAHVVSLDRNSVLRPAAPGAAGASTLAALTSSPVAAPITFSTNAAGLPLLTSRADGGGLKVFLDFDGYGSDTPYTLDSDGATFNTAEQAVIYKCWRDILSFFSMLDVNITTVQPPTGGNNPVFVWQRIVSNLTGGAAYVGWLTNNSSQGYNAAGDASGRTSGIAHEIGHQLNLNHQSDWSNAGVLTAAYTSGWDQRHGPIMGVDYAQTVKKWINGRTEPGADQLQDDLATMAAFIAARVGGTGYMPDDFTGTGPPTATALPLINGAFQTAGAIERTTDSDFFSFTSAGQTFNINVEPTFESGFVPKLELYDSTGKLLTAKDDAVYRAGNDNHSMDFTLFLPAGTYYAKVASHGDYGDLGEYALYASPLPAGWNTADVRNLTTGRGGYVTYDASTGTFYQGGSGADIGTNTDAFRFTYQVLNGNGSITARVTGLDNTSAEAKAGLMIRESLAHNSKFALIDFRPSGSQYIYRATNGGSAASASASLSLPNWIRLSRSGSVITLSQSTDGVNWTTAGTVTLTSLATQVYIGLATHSHNTKQQATATFTNVSLTGSFGTAAATFNALPAPTSIAAAPVATQATAIALGWNDSAGETGYAVETSVDGVTWTPLITLAANVTTYTHEPGFGSMRFWYRVAALDATGRSVYSDAVSAVNKPGAPTSPQAIAINGTKLSITWRDVSADAGYRIERSTDGGATYTTVVTTPANITFYNSSGLAVGTAYTYRITPLGAAGDGIPLVFAATTPLGAPSGISLSGITTSSVTVNWSPVAGATGYTIFRSTDGSTITPVGTANGATTLSFIDTGLAPLTPYYYNVQPFNSTNTGLSSATVFASTLASPALPSPWLQTDIGAVAGAGQAGPGAARGSYTVNASGSDIAGSADSFRFVYQPLTGDTMIVAQVASVFSTATAAKAGLMIRQDLSASSRFAGIFLNQGGNYGIDLRTRTTASSQYTYTQALAGVAAPYYLKLTRTGNTITLAYSANGTSYTTASTLTMSFSGTVYIGLAVTAFSATRMNVATFNNVQLGLTPPTVATPAAASPSPVAGTIASLSVLGADNSGEDSLTYTWSATGPAPVTFSANGTNAAKNTTATFSAAGTYTLTATIADGGNLLATSSTSVAVDLTLTGIGPLNTTLLAGTTQQMFATDQFGHPMSISGISWTASAGVITSGGRFTAPAAGGPVTITGTTGAFVKTTTVTVVAPRAWYKNDVPGSTVLDASGNNADGTATGSYAYGPGIIANGLAFSGGYATLPAGLVSTLNDFTITAWVKLSSRDTWSRIFDFGTGTGVNMFLTPIAGDGYLRYAITTGGGSAEQRITTTTTLNAGTWYFLAVTLSGTTATLYVNGTVVGTNTAMTLTPGSLGTTTLNYLGKSQNADPALNGMLDDLRIYSTAAPAATIAALYAAGTNAATSAPTNVTATASLPTRVDVRWSDNTGVEAAYLVERAANASFTAGLTAITLPADTTAYTDTTVNDNTAYYYRVTALLAGNTAAGPITAAVKLPVPGDANVDGKVDAFDLNILAAHWQLTGSGGPMIGDFNNDGAVDAFDLNIIAAHWQEGVTLSAGMTAEQFVFTVPTASSAKTSSTSPMTATTAAPTLPTAPVTGASAAETPPSTPGTLPITNTSPVSAKARSIPLPPRANASPPGPSPHKPIAAPGHSRIPGAPPAPKARRLNLLHLLFSRDN
jgi:regulation of enolase protein 1 (concanavalin A-like superfamily)